MIAQQILLDMLNRGVQVGVDGPDLSVRAVKGALSPTHRESIQAAKAEIIQFIGDNRRLARMSFAQRRMWFIDQLTPDSALYSATAATYRLLGTIDVAALEASINDVVRRHEALRTTFPFVNGEPVQSVHTPRAIEVPLTDFSDRSTDDREAMAMEAATELVRQPFDLASGPLFRPALIRIYSEDHILVLPMHHIINDGWSVGVLYRELRECYAAHVSGRSADLPELKAQYSDLSEMQHQFAENDDGKEQLAYWKQQLGGTIPALNLTSDTHGVATQGFEGGRARIMLRPEIGDALKRLGREEGASLYMVGLAAYFMLLHRYTRNEDIVVGSPIAGRTLEHAQDLLGLFVNTVALRASVRPDDSLRDVVSAVRDSALGAFANQDVPFDKVVAEVQPDRDLTHSPLFRVMFVLQNAPIPESNFGAARLEPLELNTGTAKFDLSLELAECDEGIRATLEYSDQLFDDVRAQGMLDHYETLLDSMVTNPDQSVAEVDIIPAAERERILLAFNDTAKNFADTRPVHQRFADWAIKQPDAPAILWEQGSLTYAELDRAALGLAHQLQNKGIGRNDIVAVCAPRSREMIVAQLAVLKAGAAYLSLDPEHPFERLKDMVLDANARALLLIKDHAAHFPNIDTITIDLGADGDGTPIKCNSDSDDLAYVIYTSGSTGKPKGVAVEHAGLSNLAAWHQGAFNVDETDRGSQLASPAFDASVWEIWPYLSAGAAVTLCPDAVRSEPSTFRDWMLAERVTVGFAPTDLIESLFALDWPEETPLHHLLTGGAWLNERPPASLPFEVINNYGPTENSVVTTSGAVTADGEESRLPSIGRPVANHQVFILDESLRIVPLGVSGELYVGGIGLAREYIDDPERTGRQFVIGPADSPSPSRLYKTGDRGRFRADGSIQFLGRCDHQVNVRGHRIELGELEAAAKMHSDVAEAVAMPLVDESESGASGREYGLRLFVSPRMGDATPDDADVTQLHIRQWQSLYDETYAESPINIDPALNIIGWNSSYTGAPIPTEEMREWRDGTVERLRALHPKRVLEIGCGTGMILAELAPECESYVGVDFSAEALDYVRTHLVEKRGLGHVELVQAAAHELDALDGQTFDLVVLNSVIQYFPSAEYLQSVVEHALRCTSSGGAVFVGDVRNHALLNEFHAMVQLRSVPPETSTASIVNRINRRVATEEELSVAPEFFHRIARDESAVTGVHTLVKRGHAENELVQFRYDTLLWVGGDASAPSCQTVDWASEGSTVNEIRHTLASHQPHAMRITGIPNERVAEACSVWAALANRSANDHSVGDFLDRTGRDNGVAPEFIIEQFNGMPYTVSLHCNLDHPSCFDALLVKDGADARAWAEPAAPTPNPSGGTNAPLDAGHLRVLATDLRDHLQRHLPEYMLPNRIVPLAAFPRTASGKADRQALCAIDDAHPVAAQYVAPRNELEEAITDMWRTLLGVDRVGVEDNFFELGGHSLLATQLVAQICEAYAVELPLRELFVRPTPAGIAVTVEEALMREIENLTEDEAARLVAS
jgi:amino acid adenylation domain-containing protein